MLKSTKNAVAVALIALCTACGQDNPTPSTTNTVVTPPPTPPTTPNKCDNIKNPLEEIEWLKKTVQECKQKNYRSRITQYTYQGQSIYYVVINTGIVFAAFVKNCDSSIQFACSSEGIAGCGESNFDHILLKSSTPIVLFEM